MCHGHNMLDVVSSSDHHEGFRLMVISTYMYTCIYIYIYCLSCIYIYIVYHINIVYHITCIYIYILFIMYIIIYIHYLTGGWPSYHILSPLMGQFFLCLTMAQIVWWQQPRGYPTWTRNAQVGTKWFFRMQLEKETPWTYMHFTCQLVWKCLKLGYPQFPCLMIVLPLCFSATWGSNSWRNTHQPAACYLEIQLV